MDLPGYPGRTPDDLIAAYVSWLRTHDESAEWAWEVMHDGVWFSFEPLDALEWLISIADELAGEGAALKELGAGPLEDLLGGDPATMDRALEATRSSDAFRIAVANVAGVKHGEPGYAQLHQAVAGELDGG